MEKKLSRLFDYQNFTQNSELADVIADVDSRYPMAKELSDDDLMNVAAAGMVAGCREEGREKRKDRK